MHGIAEKVNVMLKAIYDHCKILDLAILHATTDAKHQVKSVLLHDVVITERSAIFQLLAGENQALHYMRDLSLVLNLGLHIVNGVVGMGIKGDGLASNGLDEDLHATAERKVEGSPFLMDPEDSWQAFTNLPDKGSNRHALAEQVRLASFIIEHDSPADVDRHLGHLPTQVLCKHLPDLCSSRAILDVHLEAAGSSHVVAQEDEQPHG